MVEKQGGFQRALDVACFLLNQRQIPTRWSPEDVKHSCRIGKREVTVDTRRLPHKGATKLKDNSTRHRLLSLMGTDTLIGPQCTKDSCSLREPRTLLLWTYFKNNWRKITYCGGLRLQSRKLLYILVPYSLCTCHYRTSHIHAHSHNQLGYENAVSTLFPANDAAG